MVTEIKFHNEDPPNTFNHFTKFSRQRDLATGICANVFSTRDTSKLTHFQVH